MQRHALKGCGLKWPHWLSFFIIIFYMDLWLLAWPLLSAAQYRCNCSPCTPTPFHPNAPSPAKSRDIVRRHAEQSALLYKHLSSLLSICLARVYPRMQTKTLHLLLFIRDALRTASPRFGEILNLTGYLINLSLPKMP
ncbi:hypothetical protein HDV62DRAFT_128629 [Trichoderma sp. SZMC 28011]